MQAARPGTSRTGCWWFDALDFGFLFEVAGSALTAVALVAGGDVLQLSLRENRFHLDLAAAGAEKLLRNHVDTGVLANFCHNVSPFFFL
jgi:hypothetical protein